jgi:hypothetical protein
MAVPVEPTTPKLSPAARGASPRMVNIVLGVWLFLSAFLWPHTQAQLTNTWIVGVLCVIFALIAMAVPWVRYLNTLLAIWLFISAWALPMGSPGTIWNNVLVAIAIFVASLIPSEPGAEAGGFFGRPTPPRPI